MARVQGLKPKPNHLRPNFKVWFSILAELNSEFSLGLTKNALNQTKLNFGSTKPNEPAGPFIVAKESHALHSIIIQVDNQKSVESVVDPGSQIIAMSEDICHSLGLPYDPSIILHMQSANGEVDKSLGLARNVPCTVGSVTL